METFAQTQHRSLASRVMRWCAQAWRSTAETDVIGRLDDQTLQELSRDCGIPADQLKRLANAGPHAADEMAALMLATGIDPAAVARLHPQQFRDMQVDCSLCDSKDRCRQDLAAQTADREHVQYCSNADHLKALQQEAALLTA